MAKIYLSAAAHAVDNTTKCPSACGENVHCNAYMDLLEKRLKENGGFEVKRGDKKLTGSEAMSARVKEANAWKADIYYVAHTNAGGGRYSLTLCYPSAESKNYANILHKYRTSLKTHKVKTTKDLYEINATAMPCIYDELFFHDNAEDCRWFHNTGMKLMAEETLKALCEICKVPYIGEKKPVTPVKPTKISVTYQVWDDVKNTWLPPVTDLADYAGIFKHDVCAVYADLNEGDITYQVHYKNGKWLGEIKNREDYAGIYNKPIDAIRMKTNTGKTIHYRVHLRRQNKWLPYVTGYNTSDSDNGYAGILGQEIDAIQIYVG